eukprot:m.318847 g.318847  ORF g.318847 m.318847 type:complete len:75 (-) comp15990_c0_seq38:3535-3759(-)
MLKTGHELAAIAMCYINGKVSSESNTLTWFNAFLVAVVTLVVATIAAAVAVLHSLNLHTATMSSWMLLSPSIVP